jgi:hypothetical protein
MAATDPEVIKSRLADVAKRYRKRKRGRRLPPLTFAAIRVRDLDSLFAKRYGHRLPDDDAGRDDAEVMAHHLAMLSGDPRQHITDWMRRWAPWLTLVDLDALQARAIVQTKRWSADQLAWRLRLTEAERIAYRITTIGAIDLSNAERTKRRHQRNIEAKRTARRTKGAMSRAEYEAKALSRAKPWIAEGISRRTWYRRRGTSPGTAILR